MKSIILVVFLISGCLLIVPSSVGAEEITFTEAWHLLLQKNDGLAAERAGVERDLQLLVEKTYHEAMQSLEEHDGLGTSLELARENVRLREIAFSQGLSTSLDVIDGQLFLARVKKPAPAGGRPHGDTPINFCRCRNDSSR